MTAAEVAKRVIITLRGPEWLHRRLVARLENLNKNRRRHGRPNISINSYVLKLLEKDLTQRCRECGRTDDDCAAIDDPAGGPCQWVDDDLCSDCAGGNG